MTNSASAEALLKEGTSPSGAQWELRFRETEEGDCLELTVSGSLVSSACGFDIPGTTEIGYNGGLKPGKGDFFLYGFTSPRIATIVAEGSENETRVQTEDLPNEIRRPGLRFFVLMREPVENVDALVGLDADQKTVQRAELAKPPSG